MERLSSFARLESRGRLSPHEPCLFQGTSGCPETLDNTGNSAKVRRMLDEE
jgi:hypothetical protein